MRRSLFISTVTAILLLGACSGSPTASERKAVPALRADGGGFLAGSGSFVPPTNGTGETESAATTSAATDSLTRGGPLAGSGS
jgi:hypothetical protein